MRLYLSVGFLFGLALILPAAAPPSDPKLKKSVEQFEKSMADADKQLRSSLVKASDKAKDKATFTKIEYEFNRFEKTKELPTVVPVKDYLRMRDAAVTALASKYEPAIKALRAGKNASDADELEQEYAEVLKKGRGFGLALPADPSLKPLVVIRSKDGQALEPVDPKRAGSFVILAKYVRGKPNQAWYLDRGESGVVFRTALGDLCLHVPAGTRNPGDRLVLWGPEVSPPNDSFSWKVEERLREAMFASAYNDLVLSTREVNEKGVLNVYLTQETAEKMPPAAHLWKIELVK